jgi:hypothetical protein
MGVSTTPRQLAMKLERLAREIRDTRKPLTAAAFAAKQAFIATTPGVVGHRVPRRSRGRINVHYDIRGDVAIVRYTGPAHLVLNPTKPHRIEPGRTRSGRRRRGGKRALTINDGFAAYVPLHPGTGGKDPGARRAKAAAAVVVPKVYQRVGLHDPLRRVF